MKVYVVANLKGGVGKTTTTVNVAYTFSEMGGRVLVIDLDPQCNCTRFFAKVNGYSKTIRDVLENPKGINSAVYRTKYQDIDIVKGSVKITEQKTPWRLKKALGYLKKGNVAAIASLMPLRPSAQIIRISFTPRFFSSFRTDSQYFELSLSPTVIERTSFFPSVLMPRMT